MSHYLRALARDLKEKTGGKGVGVIGQCFSGGFALAAAVDDSVLAPVLSQPSVPLALTAKQQARPRAVRRRDGGHREACGQGRAVRAGSAVQRGSDGARRAVQDAQGPAR